MYKNPEQLRKELQERQYQRTVAYNARHKKNSKQKLRIQISRILEPEYCTSVAIPEKVFTDLCIQKAEEAIHVGVYLIKCGDFPYYKIGITRSIERRLHGLQAACPFLMSCLIYVKKGDLTAATTVETLLHHHYRKHNMHREWFELSDKQVKDIMQEIAGID